MSRVIIPAILVSLTLAQACDDSTTSPSAPVASVEVRPAAPQITAGQSIQLTVTLRDRWQRVLTGRPVTWSTEPNVSVAVSPNGLVTGLVAGTAVVTASSEGRHRSVIVTVRPPASASRFEASATGAVTASFTGKAVFDAASDEYGNPRFVLLMVNGTAGGAAPGTSYRLHFSRPGRSRPATGEFAIEHVSVPGDPWIAGYQVMDGDGIETAYFAAVSGTLRITASSFEQLAGEFEFEARSSRYGLPPMRVTVTGTFDAALATLAGQEGDVVSPRTARADRRVGPGVALLSGQSAAARTAPRRTSRRSSTTQWSRLRTAFGRGACFDPRRRGPHGAEPGVPA